MKITIKFDKRFKNKKYKDTIYQDILEKEDLNERIKEMFDNNRKKVNIINWNGLKVYKIKIKY